MRPRRSLCPAVVCLLLLGTEASIAAEEAADPTWQFALTPNYSSGSYGTGANTSIVYTPLSIQRLFKDGDVALVVPFVSVTGDGSVTLLSGVPNRRTTVGTAVGPRVTEVGLGDLVLRGRYYALDQAQWWPTIALTARLKIPTADRSRGLGTGEPDEGFGMEVSRTLGEKWVFFTDAGFTFIGKPAGYNLRNQWNYDVGLGYYFTKALTLSLYFEEYRAAVQGNQNPQDLLLSLNYDWSPRMSFNASTQIGLSDGAPDYALGVGISVKY